MKPILFSTPMVQAILAGTKTQTRRIMKPQPPNQLYPCGTAKLYWAENPNDLKAQYFHQNKGVEDVLWVRETFLVELLNDVNHYVYKADYSDTFADDACWKPSIFMPREAARLFLRVTGVRVERLQDISENDAIDEGIERIRDGMVYHDIYKNYIGRNYDEFLDPISSYMTLWDKINGPGSWDKNPWVWVYTFERIEKPE